MTDHIRYGRLFAISVGSVGRLSCRCCRLLQDGHISQVRDYFTLVVLNILRTTLLPLFYPINMQHSSCKHVFSIRVETSVNPDQMASSEAT